LREWAEEVVRQIPAREAAALVFDLDQDTLFAGVGAERHRCTRSREFEGVLQQVHDHRREHLPVRQDHCVFLDRHHDEGAAADAWLERCGGKGAATMDATAATSSPWQK
jgi:hypothetical protein